MAIPEYEFEVFPLRPLKTAICQVRFNEILRISSEEPARFQEHVAGTFSKFVRTQNVIFAFGGGQVGAAPSPGTVWQFSTKDDSYVLGLSGGSLSLEARAYTDFTKFAEFLKIGLDALVTVYAPPTFSRIGLRYVNEVVRISPMGSRLDWRTWVNKELVPQIVCDPNLVDEVQGSGHLVTFQHTDGMVNVRYGFQRGRLDDKTAEAFTLDMDSFVEAEIAPDDAIARAGAFNRWLYRFFRWAVGEHMLELMRGNRDDKDVIFGAATT
jgi:uncharacterized protein (TIGR04255 family)